MRAMLSLSRYLLAVVVVIVASLTPSSCSDVAEQAMAYEDTDAVVIDQMSVERSMQGVDLKLDRASSRSDAHENGS